MSKPKITRIWGKADSFDIEFSENEDGKWVCIVPPDTQDGQYACEIRACNEAGKTAYWTGILYMCNGVCHLKIYESKLKIIFAQMKYSVSFLPVRYNIFIRKGCQHHV